MLNRLLLGVLGLALPCLFSCKQPAVSPALRSSSQTRLPGPQPDGSVLLPNQWSLRPAGRQIELRDFPANVALHPSGRYAAVLHTGYGSHQISIVDLPSEKTVAHVNITQAFYGLEFSKDGKHLFCSGAGDEVIHSFDFEGFTLSNHQQIRLRPIKERGIPSGLAVSADGKTIFAANLWADRISRITVGVSNITEIALTPGTHALLNVGLQPALDPDVAAATKRSEVSVFDYRPEDTFPYACRLDEKRHRLYVSLWAQSAVAVIESHLKYRNRQVVNRRAPL